MVGMNKEPIESDRWPVEIGEQMAAVHRVYSAVDTTADLRLRELLAEEIRAYCENPAH
jgi:hypothetical protein